MASRLYSGQITAADVTIVWLMNILSSVQHLYRWRHGYWGAKSAVL